MVAVLNIKHALGASFVFTLALWVFSGLGSLWFPQPVINVLRSALELISTLPGFIIFFIVWYGSNQETGPRITMISLVMASTSILNLAHLLAYPGIPILGQTDTTAIWGLSSLFASMLWSFGLLYAVCLPTNGPTTLPAKTLLYSTFFLIAGLIANITLNYNVWLSSHHPIVYYTRYLATIADFFALLMIRRNATGQTADQLLQVALLFGILADFSFAFTNHLTQTLNMSGHLSKIVANFYLLFVCQFMVIRKPYEEMLQYKEELEALAANNAKLYQESEQQRNLIEDTLAKIGAMISSQLNLKDTLDSIADMVADLMGARQSAIALLHKDLSSLQVSASYGINTPPAVIPLATSLAGQVLEQKAALYISDLSVHPELFRPQLIFSNIRSIICAPLVNDQELIGVIEAYSSEKGAFGDADALLLKALGHHAGAAITSAMQYEETKIRLDEEKFLYQIAHSAASTIDTDTIIDTCTKHVIQALNADVGIGLLTNSQRGLFTVRSALGLTCGQNNIELSEYPELAAILDTQKPAAVSADVFPFLNDHCEDGIIKQLIILPLSVDQRLLGLIVAGWQRYVAPEHLERPGFPALMAQQIALGLEKAQLYNQIKAMALSDGLTGLANRRNFDMFLRTELRRASSLQRPLSLIMLDLDKFKSYNDTYGHLTGDKLLAQIGEILRHGVRSIDFPARYGGEEFSIILPECSNSEAVNIAEKLRHTVETTQFPDNMTTYTARITASLGIATYDPSLLQEQPDMEKLISVADKALYQAKQEGRNRVISATVFQ
jgi:diguanylate cyclase (GGDEF)-like protein